MLWVFGTGVSESRESGSEPKAEIADYWRLDVAIGMGAIRTYKSSMRHDWSSSNRMGYDPRYWRSMKMTAWASAGALAAAIFALIAMRRWPEAVETVFAALGLLALMSLVWTWKHMWDNRRYHPRYGAKRD